MKFFKTALITLLTLIISVGFLATFSSVASGVTIFQTATSTDTIGDFVNNVNDSLVNLRDRSDFVTSDVASTTEIIYQNGDSLAGDSSFTFTSSTPKITIQGDLAVGTSTQTDTLNATTSVTTELTTTTELYVESTSTFFGDVINDFTGSGLSVSGNSLGLTNNSVSYGGVSVSLGGSDATPAFDLTDASSLDFTSGTNVSTSSDISLDPSTDTIGLTNNSVSYGGVSVSLGGSNATPAFDLTDASSLDFTAGTNVATSSDISLDPSTDTIGLVNNAVTITAGTGLNGGGSVSLGNSVSVSSTLGTTVDNSELTNSSVSYGGVSVSLGGTNATPAFDLTDATSLDFSAGTNASGGNHITLNGDAIDSDTENQADDITFSIQNATSTSADASEFHTFRPFTISKVTCTGASNDINLEERPMTSPDTSGTDVLTSNLTCGGTTGTASSTAFSNASIASDSLLKLDFRTNPADGSNISVGVQIEYDE